MSHALSLALVYALFVQAVQLLRAACGSWAVLRGLVLDRPALDWIALAATLGMALAAGAVTGGLARDVAGWLSWACGIGLLVVVAGAELSSRGALWRAMAGNAPGLVRAGIALRPGLPLVLGLALAAMAGLAAPGAPTALEWLPLACLALLFQADPDRRPGRMVHCALLAFFAGALVGGLALLLPPLQGALVIGGLTLATVALALGLPPWARAG